MVEGAAVPAVRKVCRGIRFSLYGWVNHSNLCGGSALDGFLSSLFFLLLCLSFPEAQFAIHMPVEEAIEGFFFLM